MASPRPARRTYARLLRYLGPHRARLTAALLASILAAAAGAAYAYLVGPLLRGVLEGEASGPWSHRQRWELPLAVVGVAAVKAVAQLLQGGWMQGVGQGVMTDLRRALYAQLLRLPPSFFEARHSGELLSRFGADTAQVEFAVTQALSSYVKDTLQVLALLGVCAVIDLRLFALAFIVLPAAIVPVSRFARSVKKVATRTQASLGQLAQLASEVVQGLPVVQGFRAERRLLAAFDAEQSRYAHAMRRSLFLRGAFTPTLELMGLVGVALALGFGAQAVAREPALAGKLLSFLAAALLMYQPLKALSGTFALVVQGVAAAERLFEVADAPLPVDALTAAGPLRTALALEDLRVTYASGKEALAGLSLRVRAGERVALVGASGGGKTTLFSALLRFIEPSAGRVLWDGADTAALSVASLRAQIAWVPQEPVLFSGSVRSNLLLGRPEAADPELWEALRLAHAEQLVRELPGGLEAEVGERGGRLSGGQRQRLAIARAFLRRPSLLLLDEPTSALDAASEEAVQAGLAQLMKGRTVVVIAHRLSTVRDADRLFVLDEGALVEEGTHAELLARNGRYAALLQQAPPRGE